MADRSFAMTLIELSIQIANVWEFFFTRGVYPIALRLLLDLF